MIDGKPSQPNQVHSDPNTQPPYPWAHIITGSRLLLVLPTAWFIVEQHWWLASACFTAAVVSDFMDGRVARALGSQSNFGGLFDHATDAIFVAVTLAACAVQSWVTPWLPPLVIAAFVQYSLDSKALAGAKLRANWLGRSNGIAYYVMVGISIGFALLTLPQTIPLLLSWLLSATTLISMLNRGQYWWRHRATIEPPSSPS